LRRGEKVCAALSAVKSDHQRKKKEDSILRNCPGAASHFVSALREERRGETGRAIDRYREALRLDDTLAEAHGNLGLLLLQKGRGSAAVELNRGLTGKSDPRYHRGLGKIHEKNKKFPEAIAAYREAVKLDPTIFRPARTWQFSTRKEDWWELKPSTGKSSA